MVSGYAWNVQRSTECLPDKEWWLSFLAAAVLTVSKLGSYGFLERILARHFPRWRARPAQQGRRSSFEMPNRGRPTKAFFCKSFCIGRYVGYTRQASNIRSTFPGFCLSNQGIFLIKELLVKQTHLFSSL